MARTLTRRQALAAGTLGAAAVVAGGAGLVQAEVLPGRYRVGRLLGACDVGNLPPTTVAPGRQTRASSRTYSPGVQMCSSTWSETTRSAHASGRGRPVRAPRRYAACGPAYVRAACAVAAAS